MLVFLVYIQILAQVDFQLGFHINELSNTKWLALKMFIQVTLDRMRRLYLWIYKYRKLRVASLCMKLYTGIFNSVLSTRDLQPYFSCVIKQFKKTRNHSYAEIPWSHLLHFIQEIFCCFILFYLTNNNCIYNTYVPIATKLKRIWKRVRTEIC